MEQKALWIRRMPEWFGAKVMTVLGVLTVASGYFAGQTFYETFLRRFEVDSAVFHAEQISYLAKGVWAFLYFGAEIPSWVGKQWKALAIPFLAFVVWLALSVCLEKYKHRWESRRPRSNTPRFQYLQKFVAGVLMLGSFLYLVVFGIPLLAAFIAIPGAIGEAAGNIEAAAVKEQLSKGCGAAKQHCVALLKDGQEVGHGFRIVQSKDRIALYLDGVTKEYELAGLTLETVPKRTALLEHSAPCVVHPGNENPAGSRSCNNGFIK